MVGKRKRDKRKKKRVGERVWLMGFGIVFWGF